MPVGTGVKIRRDRGERRQWWKKERPQSPKSKKGQTNTTDETHPKDQNQDRPGGLRAVGGAAPAEVVGSGTLEKDRDQPEDTLEHRELERWS